MGTTGGAVKIWTLMSAFHPSVSFVLRVIFQCIHITSVSIVDIQNKIGVVPEGQTAPGLLYYSDQPGWSLSLGGPPAGFLASVTGHWGVRHHLGSVIVFRSLDVG